MPKRRERPRFASTHCTTSCTATTCCGSLISAASGMAARRASTARRSRTSNSMACRSGWANWRKNSGRRRIVPVRCGRQAETAGDCNAQGPCRADGGSAGLAAHLRGRSAAGAIRVPTQAQRIGGGSPSPCTAEHRPYGGGRCRFIGLLRLDPARRTPEIGLPTQQRSARTQADQEVAGSAGGRDRRMRTSPANDPKPGRAPGLPARGTGLAPALQPLHASVHPGLEDVGSPAASWRSHRQLCR